MARVNETASWQARAADAAGGADAKTTQRAASARLLRVHHRATGPCTSGYFIQWCKERGIDRADRGHAARAWNAISGTLFH